MSDFLRMESDAQRLRQSIRVASAPETIALYGLQFFNRYSDIPTARLEPYIREFGASVIQALTAFPSVAFLPEDIIAIRDLLELIETKGAEILTADQSVAAAASANRAERVIQDFVESKSSSECNSESPMIHCLLVEYRPGLEGRGRILTLSVEVSTAKKESENDIVSVLNPVNEPDDDFLKQAKSSVRVAREYLATRKVKKTTCFFRVDFTIQGATSALTGDSLGLALAAGTVAAISRYEVTRNQYSVSHEVAFAGAVSNNGEIKSIDGAGLKIKIRRAFFSNLRYLIVPRQHLGEAWDFVKTLEKEYPGRTLELVGAERFEAVADDPRLLPKVRPALSAYLTAWAERHSRTPRVEIPLLLILLVVLSLLIAPKAWMPWFDSNPAFSRFDLTSNELLVYNRDSVVLWSNPLPCKVEYDFREQRVVYDLNTDGKNEVLFAIPTQQACDHRDTLTCMSSEGQLLFKLSCVIPNQYPGDSGSGHYSPAGIDVFGHGDDQVIVTSIAQSNPGRSHIRFWTHLGDSLGWYINAGGSAFRVAKDIDGDGRSETVFAGFNNRLNASVLFVLDPARAEGVAPPYSDSNYDLHWVRHGSQLAYLVFPVTDLGKLDLRNPYNSPLQLLVHESGLLDFNVGESSASINGDERIIYSIDSRMRVVDCWPTDQFRVRRDQLVTEGKLPPVNWSEYVLRVRNAVLYWTDSGWVSESQLRSAGQ